MSETCKSWLGPVNSCVYYARQTREIYEVLLYAVDPKASGMNFEIPKEALSLRHRSRITPTSNAERSYKSMPRLTP